MYALSLFLAGAAALGADAHGEANPVFQQLVSEGVSPAEEKYFPLPAPTMADGLDAAAQRKIVTDIAKVKCTFAEFTRATTVAPHVLRMPKIAGSDPRSPMKAVDIFFVAYGDMEALTNKNFLQNAFDETSEKEKEKQKEGEEAKGESLTPEKLAERKITIAAENEERESYGESSIQLISRVELRIVGHSLWSRTDGSLLTAAVVDPRFQDDAEFPNVWLPLSRSKAGKLEKGKPQSYRAGGVYMKITKLAAPAGALFVEVHVVYNEPLGWFDGKNLLGAKIPAVAQQKVREMRQEMLRAKPAANKAG